MVHADTPSASRGHPKRLAELMSNWIRENPPVHRWRASRSGATTTRARGARLGPRPSRNHRCRTWRPICDPTVGGPFGGLFLDMREVRQWLRSACMGRSVLNLFAYTCSLGVCAALAGASRVVNSTCRGRISSGAKPTTRSMACPSTSGTSFTATLSTGSIALRAARRRFDLVIVDPPSFSSTPFSVTRDYSRLVAAAAGVVSRGGCLLAATNHAATTAARFETGFLMDLCDTRTEWS